MGEILLSNGNCYRCYGEWAKYDPRDSVLLPEDMWADAAEYLVKPTNKSEDGK